MSWTIYQYRDHRNHFPIEEWYDTLNTTERALLDQKVGALQQNGPEPFRADWCGPLRAGIWKLKIKTKRQLRLMLCKGPADKNRELTFLYPAVEKDRQLIPSNARERASERLKEIEADRERRGPWTRS